MSFRGSSHLHIPVQLLDDYVFWAQGVARKNNSQAYGSNTESLNNNPLKFCLLYHGPANMWLYNTLYYIAVVGEKVEREK